MYLSSEELSALILSIKVALWSVAGGVIPALLMAKLLSGSDFKGKSVLDGIIHLPLVVPPVVTGYLLLVVFGRNSSLGSFLESIGIILAFNWKGAVIASIAMSFPLMVRSIRLSMEAVDKGLEQAAATLGAGRFRTFLTVTLPLSVPGIITGCVLGFARSLGEFGATITFVSNIPGETQTLPLALYNFTQTPDGEVMAARLCVISIILALGALIGSEILAKRAYKRLRG